MSDSFFSELSVDGKIFTIKDAAAQESLAALATVAKTGKYSDLNNKPALSTVAISGKYSDLTNKPTIPTKISQLDNDQDYITSSSSFPASQVDGLSTVATTGSYNDLTNKPTIPVVPTLAEVATTGDYNDLSNKPTIPVIPTLAKVATTGKYSDLIDEPTAASSIVTAVGSEAAVGTSTKYARQDHVHNIDVAAGSNPGEITIAGKTVTIVTGGGGGGTITSVNNYAGPTVVLDATDINMNKSAEPLVSIASEIASLEAGLARKADTSAIPSSAADVDAMSSTATGSSIQVSDNDSTTIAEKINNLATSKADTSAIPTKYAGSDSAGGAANQVNVLTASPSIFGGNHYLPYIAQLSGDTEIISDDKIYISNTTKSDSGSSWSSKCLHLGDTSIGGAIELGSGKTQYTATIQPLEGHDMLHDYKLTKNRTYMLPDDDGIFALMEETGDSLILKNTEGLTGKIYVSALNENHSYLLPDKDGTLAIANEDTGIITSKAPNTSGRYWIKSITLGSNNVETVTNQTNDYYTGNYTLKSSDISNNVVTITTSTNISSLSDFKPVLRAVKQGEHYADIKNSTLTRSGSNQLTLTTTDLTFAEGNIISYGYYGVYIKTDGSLTEIFGGNSNNPYGYYNDYDKQFYANYNETTGKYSNIITPNMKYTVTVTSGDGREKTLTATDLLYKINTTKEDKYKYIDSNGTEQRANVYCSLSSNGFFSKVEVLPGQMINFQQYGFFNQSQQSIIQIPPCAYWNGTKAVNTNNLKNGATYYISTISVPVSLYIPEHVTLRVPEYAIQSDKIVSVINYYKGKQTITLSNGITQILVGSLINGSSQSDYTTTLVVLNNSAQIKGTKS